VSLPVAVEAPLDPGDDVAAEEVLEKIPQCAMVAHEIEGGGAMLDITRMRAIAEENEKADTVFNYASNQYTDLPPEGAAWATITRVSADVVQILMAYRNAEGAWRFKLVLATAAGGLQISPLPDLALDLQAQGDDAADPVRKRLCALFHEGGSLIRTFNR
jgi:hypothetical protein